MKSRIVVGSLALVLGCWLNGNAVAADVAPGKATHAGTPVKMEIVRAGLLPNAETAAMRLGKEKGFFAANGIDLQVVDTSSGAASITALIAGQFDVVFANTVSVMQGRDKGLPLVMIAAASTSTGVQGKDFSALVVSSHNTMKTAKDLAGKTVSVQTGSTYYEQVNKGNFAKTVKNYPSDSDARTALVSSRVDAWVTDRFTALETAHKNPTLKLQLGDLLFTERIAAAAAKGNTSLAQAWNKALEASFADGSYAQLSTKYFGQDVRCK
jgi:ABC-type amino acid transport substrate-binding protein